MKLSDNCFLQLTKLVTRQAATNSIIGLQEWLSDVLQKFRVL